MTTFQPARPHSDSITRPECPKCSTAMRLFGIEPEAPGFELLSFECPKCLHIAVKQGKQNRPPPGGGLLLLALVRFQLCSCGVHPHPVTGARISPQRVQRPP